MCAHGHTHINRALFSKIICLQLDFPRTVVLKLEYAPPAEFLIQYFWDEVQEFAFLTRQCQMMPLLLVSGALFENCYHKEMNRTHHNFMWPINSDELTI